MAYTAKKWADHPTGGTVIDAESLNRIENGLQVAHETADAAATASEVQSLAATTVEQQESLDLLGGRMDAVEAGAVSFVYSEWEWGAQTVSSNATLTALAHVTGSSEAAYASGSNVAIDSNAKFAIVTANFYCSYSAGTSSRRRFQVLRAGEDSANYFVSSNVIAGIDSFSGDRHTATFLALPGGTYEVRSFQGNSCTVQCRFRIMVVY